MRISDWSSDVCSSDLPDLSSVLLMCAGAPVPESLLHQYLERGAKVTQGYGLTESTAVVSLLESDFATAKLGSAGMPYPLTAVQLRDPEGAVITDADRKSTRLNSSH